MLRVVAKRRPAVGLGDVVRLAAPIAEAVAPKLTGRARAAAASVRKAVAGPPARERSQEPVTGADLRRLAVLALERHAELVRQSPPRRDLLVMVCLAQGAAVHRVTGRGGVKDFDVWLFYADRPGTRLNARARATADFGPSAHGRRPADPARYRGRRVDIMARAIVVPSQFDVDATAMPWPDRVAAVRGWLASGAKDTSPWWLRQKPLVEVWPPDRLGEVVHQP